MSDRVETWNETDSERTEVGGERQEEEEGTTI